jgi:hypothetical protein
MINWIVIVSVITASAFALRGVAEFVVIIWSLRADEKGRKHALVLLQQLRSRRERKPP